MVGNGVADQKYDGNALVPFAHGMGLISDNIFEEVVAACQGTYYPPQSEICIQKLELVDEVHLLLLAAFSQYLINRSLYLSFHI